jgi:chemosensory pili system protein ChpA (sensor histidine kinase/response regulator)
MESAFPPEDHEARVVDLRPRHAARRLLDAESELDALRERLAEVVAERDDARSAARDAHGAALSARQELAARLVAEGAALTAVAALRGQVEELRVRAEARDARDALLARLAGELAAAARAAREDVERHAAARANAEAALEVERRRVEEAAAALAAERDRAGQAEGALRAELEALRTARDRAVRAEADAQAARRAELEALRAARDRLAPAHEPTATPDGLILDLGRAAERLRDDGSPARRSALRRLAALLLGR